MSGTPRDRMREFWDEKARENATYYISSFRDYDDQDPAEFWAWGEKLTQRLLDESRIPFSWNERVLEIGCGIGRMTVPLARRFAFVTGIDVSGEMVRRASESLRPFPNARASVGSGVDLSEFADGSFDFVFSYLVLQHVPEPDIVHRYLIEIGRVLAPGGWCHVQLNGEPPAPAARSRPMAAALRARVSGSLRALGLRRGTGPRGLDSPAWRGCRVPIADAKRTLIEAGLVLERSSGEGTQYLWLTARRP
jgi:SAM-dependent methyltransferase